MTAAVGLLAGIVVGFTVNAVSVHAAGGWLVWLAGVLLACGVCYRYLVRPARKCVNWCVTTADKAEQIIDSYPSVRDLVKQITEVDLPAIESRLETIEEQGTLAAVKAAEVAEALAASTDTGEHPITQ